MAQEILEMDKNEVDEMLTNGHDWATDHISAAKESIEHVHDWLNSKGSEEVELNEENPDMNNIKGFDSFED